MEVIEGAYIHTTCLMFRPMWLRPLRPLGGMYGAASRPDVSEGANEGEIRKDGKKLRGTKNMLLAFHLAKKRKKWYYQTGLSLKSSRETELKRL